jgi:hypothetical protein
MCWCTEHRRIRGHASGRRHLCAAVVAPVQGAKKLGAGTSNAGHFGQWHMGLCMHEHLYQQFSTSLYYRVLFRQLFPTCHVLTKVLTGPPRVTFGQYVINVCPVFRLEPGLACFGQELPSHLSAICLRSGGLQFITGYWMRKKAEPTRI